MAPLVKSIDLTDIAKIKAVEELFKSRHFEQAILVLCVRRHLRNKLSPRDPVVPVQSRTFLAEWAPM